MIPPLTHAHRRFSGETRRWKLLPSSTAFGLLSGTSTGLRSVGERRGSGPAPRPAPQRLTKELPPVLARGHPGQLGDPGTLHRGLPVPSCPSPLLRPLGWGREPEAPPG